MTSIYFAKCGDHIKIGIARNVKQRVSSLQVGSAAPILLLGAVKGGAHEEQRLHKLLSEHRVQGEWFRDCPDVRDAIEAATDAGDWSGIEAPVKAARPIFSDVAKLLWPHKTAAHLATIANCNERAASRWLSGEHEPPISIVLAVNQKIFGRRE